MSCDYWLFILYQRQYCFCTRPCKMVGELRCVSASGRKSDEGRFNSLIRAGNNIDNDAASNCWKYRIEVHSNLIFVFLCRTVLRGWFYYSFIACLSNGNVYLHGYVKEELSWKNVVSKRPFIIGQILHDFRAQASLSIKHFRLQPWHSSLVNMCSLSRVVRSI